MGTLMFNVKNTEEAKKVVNFWNPYCKGFTPMSGLINGSNTYYIIKYDLHNRIESYICMDNVDTEGAIVYNKDNWPRFMSFPQEIRDVMIEKSIDRSPIPFILDLTAGDTDGGFTWSYTVEGTDFWSDVIENKNFSRFYNYFNIKKDESRLFEQESPLRRGSGDITSGVCCRKHKARVTIISPCYQEVIGRG